MITDGYLGNGSAPSLDILRVSYNFLLRVIQLRFSFFTLPRPIPCHVKQNDELNISVCYRKGKCA
jgi:hypothetical protein